ncbi:unnamed protein product, partial [Symbiodinium microadriaticum]
KEAPRAFRETLRLQDDRFASAEVCAETGSRRKKCYANGRQQLCLGSKQRLAENKRSAQDRGGQIGHRGKVREPHRNRIQEEHDGHRRSRGPDLE